MKCTTCFENEAEENSTLCPECDREEWKEATIRGNKRFKEAEHLLGQMHSAAFAYMASVEPQDTYPTSHESMIEMLKAKGVK